MADYYKLSDDEIERAMFTNENVESFVLYQKCVEIVGMVDKPELRSQLIKFNLVNPSVTSTIIQVVIFDPDVRERTRKFIVDGSILHFDGLFVNNKHSTFSNSNINYDLIMGTNSQCTLIKESPKYQNSVVENSPVTVTDIENCLKHTGTIQIIAWLKQKLSEVPLDNGQLIKGCLSDCSRYKLELRMGTSCDMTEFHPGHHVKVTGVIKYAHMHPYIFVQKKDQIILASAEKKSPREYLKGACVPKRLLDENQNCTQNSQKKKCDDVNM